MPSQVSSAADKFFHALRASWITIPPSLQDSFLNQTAEYMKLEAQLRQDEHLAQYDSELYPELVSLLKIDPKQEESLPDDSRAVLHFCNQQLQLMENVFYAVRLSEYHAHPLNRGWMNLFRRWTAAETMRRRWLGLRGAYSKDFVEFAEYHLNLRPDISTTVIPEDWNNPTYPESLMKVFKDLKSNGSLWKLSSEGGRDNLKSLFIELQQEWPARYYEDYFKLFLNPKVIITVSDLCDDSRSVRAVVWGIALAAPDPRESDAIRLMVWIRGAYRRLGLGRMLLNTLLDQLGNKPLDEINKFFGTAVPKGKAHNLVVILPPPAKEKRGYQEEMAGWLRFYGWKGFVLFPEETEKETGRLRLIRPLNI